MSNDSEKNIECGCILLILIFNFLFGGWSVNYLLALLSKNIPFIWDAVIGLFIGEVSIPAAIVVAILKKFGVL